MPILEIEEEAAGGIGVVDRTTGAGMGEEGAASRNKKRRDPST